MNITLIGYGKMGKAIEAEALHRGHSISHIIDIDNQHEIETLSPDDTDIVIEFTHPESFAPLLEKLLSRGVPVVSGTTGWYDRMDEVRKQVEEAGAGFMFSSNFSVGVNILFKLNARLAALMDPYPDYDCFVEEQHHRYKADAPSGTAVTLATQLIEGLERKSRIVTDAQINRKPEPDELSVGFIRGGEIPGRHKVSFTSEIDSISIEHQAHNRRGFALGAIIAAEWLAGKQGFFNFVELF